MKKIYGIVCVGAMLLTLSGCKDATAAISNANEELVSVGDTKITNGDIYSRLKTSAGSSTLLSMVKEEIFKKENITVTDAMKKEATKNVAQLKKSFKSDAEFLTQLKQMGFSSLEDYQEKVSYPSLKETELLKKYAKEKKTSLFNSSHPVKAQIMEVAKKENATKALAELKDGKSFKDVTKSYGTTTTYKGEEAVYIKESQLPAEVLAKITGTSTKGLIKEVIEDTTNSKYYIVNLTNIDPTTFESEALDAIAKGGSTTLSQEALAHYLKKNKFQIYDIDIYNEIKTATPSYIIED